ncbi:NAD(P)H-dependent oxidoreductase [Butyrivibrio sp. XPD2002]|uniref:NAD(P)H-dependent oxidoreductase n=1 Tax=Butyrivibrio sp. XPD2002 TaxID=1280665 RepID=UPI0004226B5F|nr:NAD(P)H-dependent oxidoreductase [Butyrivibrio sp. XPD2002]
MKIVIHDLDENFHNRVSARFSDVIWADGKYAPCQGCFDCWTRHPATCGMKDSLHQICRVIGQTDDLVLITENYYGGYSTAVKNILDRAIGASTPMSTYRGWEMHHALRYGKKGVFKVIVYGDINDKEKSTWKLMVERNRLNHGYQSAELEFVPDITALEVSKI